MGVPLSWTKNSLTGVPEVTNCAPFLTPSRGGQRTTATGTSAVGGETIATLYPSPGTTISRISESLLDHALAGAMGLTRLDTKTGAASTTTWSINEGAAEGSFNGNPSADGQSAVVMSFAITAQGNNPVGTTGYM